MWGGRRQGRGRWWSTLRVVVGGGECVCVVAVVLLAARFCRG